MMMDKYPHKKTMMESFFVDNDYIFFFPLDIDLSHDGIDAYIFAYSVHKHYNLFIQQEREMDFYIHTD